MKNIAIVFLLLPFTFAQQVPSSASQGTSVAAKQPVLVELFTSEGCSDCPPADALITTLKKKQPVAAAEVIPLGLHIDYFNQLGWKDRFSDPKFTERQQSYEARLKQPDVYTPQIIVDGVTSVDSPVSALRTIANSAAAPKPMHIVLEPGEKSVRVRLQGNLESTAEANLAIVEDDLESSIKSGENQGKTLTHTAVVRTMESLGQPSNIGWTKSVELNVSSDINRAKAQVVVFLQDPKTGKVLGIGALPLTAFNRSEGK